MRKTQLSIDDEVKISNLYERNKSLRYIKTKFHIRRSRARKIIVEHGIKIQTVNKPIIDNKKVIELYIKEFKSKIDIANFFKCNKGTITHILLKNKIPLRNRSQANSCSAKRRTWISSSEKKIMNFLDELKIKYKSQYYVRNITTPFQCDVFILKLNLIIECDGEYFHYLPRKEYNRLSKKSNLKHTAGEIWDRDDLRTKDMQKLGYRVIRIPCRQIKNMNINRFKALIK